MRHPPVGFTIFSVGDARRRGPSRTVEAATDGALRFGPLWLAKIVSQGEGRRRRHQKFNGSSTVGEEFESSAVTLGGAIVAWGEGGRSCASRDSLLDAPLRTFRCGLKRRGAVPEEVARFRRPGVRSDGGVRQLPERLRSFRRPVRMLGVIPERPCSKTSGFGSGESTKNNP
jgi:hypothetical protein